jgi:hypothetical protein
MNKLIEMINYTSDAYWGDQERFKFNAKIDTYNNTTEVVQGENRVVKTNFGLTIQGYLVPDSLNKKLASENMLKTFSKSKIIFNRELVSSAPEAAQTREEIRSTRGINVEQGERGIGYEEIGTNNEIG